MKKYTKSLHYLLISLVVFAISAAFIGCNLDTTEALADPPQVALTSPTNEAVGVDVNGIITATFEEPVNPDTISETTFTLSSGTTEVAGSVSYDIPNNEAIFSPTNLLDYSTEYTATLTTGVKNVDNIPMGESKVWTFTTAEEGIGPEPVNLGTAANYVILAKTAVSTVPNSIITGNLGLSPAATSYFTGFSLTNATGYATSDQVEGFMFAADMAPPTPINLTTAVSDMEAAYTDAAGRITPDELNLGSGAIGGMTLSPGLYKWTSTVTIGSNVTISGSANDTWIFQIDGDLSLGDSFAVILTGGAQVNNIVWQVAGKVITGAGSHLEGIVLSSTEITMNTSATMNGRLLAQSQIALDQATVTEPAL
ncbi:MAG: ice-binding family protein [Spirochaetota bacterium]